MTEVSRSPELYLGKRRSSMDCDDVEVDNPAQIAKRYKVTTRIGLDGLKHGDENSPHAFKRNKSGSFTSETNAPVALVSHREQMEQYHNSVVSSLKIEHQMALNRKDQEIQRVQQENQQLQGRCQAMTHEHNACLEESRLLKRAVGIQDARYRELSSTHDQLQQVMALAAEHIAKLEHANRELTSLLNSCQYGGGSTGFSRGPPDVF